MEIQWRAQKNFISRDISSKGPSLSQLKGYLMAFKPKYTITEKILNNLTLIASAREVVEQAHLVPKWEASLRRQAKIRNTHSSTAIEGNQLTLEQVEALAEGKEIIAADKDKKEVLNYLEALDAVHSFAENGKIKVEDLLNIHKMVSKERFA